PAAWEFLSRLVQEHLRKSGMGAEALQGTHLVAARPSPRCLAVEGTGLREQLGRLAHEYLLLPSHAQDPFLMFHLGSAFGGDAAVWIQARNPFPQRQDRPHGGRYETRRPF